MCMQLLVLAAGSSAPCSVSPTPWVLSSTFVDFGDFPGSSGSPMTSHFSLCEYLSHAESEDVTTKGTSTGRERKDKCLGLQMPHNF